MVTAEDALQRLREGNRRFVAGETNDDTIARRVHSPSQIGGQNPFAIVLACSDSRVPTELIFDQGIGDLFVIRVAGNIVAPSQIGSIEFAATEFGTRLVVVLGHTHCGAIIATLRELAKEQAHRSPNLRAIVDRIRPAVEPVLERHGNKEYQAIVADAVLANVQSTVDRLRHGSLVIEELIERDVLRIVGARYSIEDGGVDFFSGV